MIQIIKGEIFKLEEFLIKTTKGLQPPLTNKFIGREQELKKCVELLKRCDRLLLSGGSGVGKSKLAVQLLEEFSKEEYIPIVIQSCGVSLWDDYNQLFLSGKQYIILFDDANKSVANLEYLLSKLEGNNTISAKVIITSRDYVKKQVSSTLDNHSYEELSLSEFKDDEIQQIIELALPDLKYNNEIKRKIVDLAKGNARLALMATYSVTPNAETNYLSSPVLLYEKYFRKISEEVGFFDSPIVLKSIAIVSFFGVLDRNDTILKEIIFTDFGVDWNELWSTIMVLHNFEILDVHPSEVVKVSDQVLATYTFYKCFIDEQSAVINYAKWIIAFVGKFSHRITATLIDTNNTFTYYHVKDLVQPHLVEVLKKIHIQEELYSFYSLFWFYKGRDCLLYLKNWITELPEEEFPENLQFSYVHNNHTRASKYFELLKNFWKHPNELNKPSLELTLSLLVKQPSRLPEILKYMHDYFKYNLEDRNYNYTRQNYLLDVLSDINLHGNKKNLANGILLVLAETLLGWHYTEIGSSKGTVFTIRNFNLYKSESLMKLRGRILDQFYILFKSTDEQSLKVLNKIVHPGGDIDKSIYIEEMPIYQKIISEKLDLTQYSHCKFVSTLSKKIVGNGACYPENWDNFLESKILKLSRFLGTRWERDIDKSYEQIQKEKIEKFDLFVKSNSWKVIESLLFDINEFYIQQADKQDWYIEDSLTILYNSIAKKDIQEFENALRIVFSGEVLYPLRSIVINFALSNNIIKGDDLLSIIDEFEFEKKSYWQNSLLVWLPEEQINEDFLKLLIDNFKNSEDKIYIFNMLDYLKYEKIFNKYKRNELKDHNIITFLTHLILSKKQTRGNLGLHFCSECVLHFTKQVPLLKDAFWALLETDLQFDYDGQELKAILSLDRTFINESLKNGSIGMGIEANLRLQDVNTSFLWEDEDYENLIEDLLLTIQKKEEDEYLMEENIDSLFKFDNLDENRSIKIRSLIYMLTRKYIHNKTFVLILVTVVYDNFRDWFIDYFREFLLLTKDIDVVKDINYSRSESWSGSSTNNSRKN